MNTTMTTTQPATQETKDRPTPTRSGDRQQTVRPTYTPRFDIWEGEQELVLYGDLPGVEPDDLEVQFENHQLMIRGRVRPRNEGVNYLYAEYDVGDFHRTFTIGETIDTERISAELHNGVLTLHLPKSEAAKPRRIQVHVH